MSYPKPLKEKTLERLYADAHLNKKQIDFLHSFVSACANLYGAITAIDAWDVYKELSSMAETVPLRRRDVYAALGIFRREPAPFYIFEVDEVYSEEKRSDGQRIIVSKDLMSNGYYKFTHLYNVMKTSVGKPFYVPKNLLEYETMPENKYERKLLDMLGRLRSTLSEYEDRFGHVHTCEYTGKLLKDFSFISGGEAFELRCLRGEVEGCKAHPEKAAELEAELNSITAAQYLVNNLKWQNTVGHFLPTKIIEYFFDDLTKMGVVLSDDKQVNEILAAIQNMLNNQNLWRNHGWTPNELQKRMQPSNFLTISFSPGIQKAFADNTIDKNELVKKLKETGVEVIE